MRAGAFIPPLAMAAASVVTGCDAAVTGDDAPGAPSYRGIETRLLDGDLVNFTVQMSGVQSGDAVVAYAECAAAQYALIRGYGFARQVRTNVTESGGVWQGDAVYTISPALPRGARTIDAEVTVSACAENGIPTV